MIYRTKTGKALHKTTRSSRKRRTDKPEGSPFTHLGALTWTFALLMVSVALAAAAVFTKKPF
jgi:hypothetical protein